MKKSESSGHVNDWKTNKKCIFMFTFLVMTYFPVYLFYWNKTDIFKGAFAHQCLPTKIKLWPLEVEIEWYLGWYSEAVGDLFVGDGFQMDQVDISPIVPSPPAEHLQLSFNR